ncbi:MAG: tetratricopeptide repeat protein [Thiotrichaceae bacterium]|nr:tetratricopeptide repeat protein [Thiotrichaceae bacterium]
MKLSSVSFDELMAQLPVLTEPEDKDWLALRFSLNQLPEKVSDALLAAAIPHWFDRDYLNALLDTPLSEDEFNALVKLSSIEPFPARGENTFNVHERTRKLLLKRLWENDQAYYKKLARKAGAYCQRQHHRDNTLWLIEGFYHKFLVDDRVVVKVFDKGEEWKEHDEFSSLELLTQSLSEHVESGKMTGDGIATIYHLQGLLDFESENYLGAKENCERALQQENLDVDIKATCLFNLGNIHYQLDEYVQAKEYLEQSLPILKSEFMRAWCFRMLGAAWLGLSEYAETREKTKKALSISKKMERNAKGLASSSQYKQISLLKKQQAACIISFGYVELLLENYATAQQYYESALNLSQKAQDKERQAISIIGLGNVAIALGNYAIAQQHYEIALDLSQKTQDRKNQAACYWNLGVLMLETMQLEQALSFFQQATQLFNEKSRKREELLSSIMLATVQNQVASMLEQLELFLSDSLNLTMFSFGLNLVFKVCEKYPEHPAFIQLRARLALAGVGEKKKPDSQNL